MRTGRCSADGGSVPSRSSSDTLYDAAAAAGSERHAGGRAEELEVNCGGKKAQQGCDRASVCVPLLQHSANAKFNGNRWGTICMQINVHLDSLLKRVQRVRLCSHDTLLQWNRSERAQITHELQKGNGAPVLLSATDVSEDLWDSECEGNMVAVENVIRGVESGLTASLFYAVLFSVLKISEPLVLLISVVSNQHHFWFYASKQNDNIITRQVVLFFLYKCLDLIWIWLFKKIFTHLSLGT